MPSATLGHRCPPHQPSRHRLLSSHITSGAPALSVRTEFPCHRSRSPPFPEGSKHTASSPAPSAAQPVTPVPSQHGSSNPLPSYGQKERSDNTTKRKHTLPPRTPLSVQPHTAHLSPGESGRREANTGRRNMSLLTTCSQVPVSVPVGDPARERLSADGTILFIQSDSPPGNKAGLYSAGTASSSRLSPPPAIPPL